MLVAADREIVQEVTVPAGVLRSAPAETDISFAPGEVVYVEIRIPAGTAGLSGFQLTNSGQQALPYNTGAFFIGDGEVIQRDVIGYNNSGRWGFRAYNEDVNPHAYQIRISIVEISKVVTPAPVLAPVGVSLAGQVEGVTGPGAPSGEPGAPAPPPTGEGEGTEPPVSPPGEGEPPPVGEQAPPPVAGPEQEPEAPSVEASPPTFGPGEEEPPPPPSVGAGEPAPTGAEGIPGETGLPEVVSQTPQPTSAGTRAGATGRTVVRVVTEHLPAGGWLPHGARYTREREDQGQDGITNWRGRIVAPGDGFVVHNLSDKPFPGGFGPHYVVVKITSGPFAGYDWYVGHCTSVVADGQHFREGATLAHADQGQREGGGWFEIGEAPGGYPGPMGNGARWAHLFGTVTRRRVERHTVAVKHGRVPPKRRPTAGKHGKPGPKRAPAGHSPHRPAGKRAPHPGAHGAPPAHHPAPVHHPPRSAPARAAHGPVARRPPPPPPRAAPRRAPPPPPPPPAARRPAPPPPSRGRHK